LLPYFVYFTDFYYWWPLLLGFQVVLGGIGLIISSWRVVASFFLIILVFFNTFWLGTPQTLPDICQETIHILQGTIKSDSHHLDSQLDFINCIVWCKDIPTKKAITRLYLPKPENNSKRYFQPGDRIELKNVKIVDEGIYGLKVKADSGFRYFNLSSQERTLNRNQLFFYIQSKARYYLDSFSLNMVKALLTADRSDLGLYWSNAFRQLGIVHIFAISGMHIGILFLWFVFVCRKIVSFPNILIYKGYGILIGDIVSIILILLFLNMIGMPISAKRAVMMLLWWLIIKHLMAWQPLWFVIFGTALVILMEMPVAIGQVSFQLSFLSVFGIISILPILPRNKGADSTLERILKYLMSTFIISCWLMLFTLPVTQNLVEYQSLLTPINNVIHIAFISLIFLPLLILVLFFNLIGFYFGFVPGEFYIYSLVNICSQFWKKMLTINLTANSHFLFQIPFQWNRFTVSLYWSLLFLTARLLISAFSIKKTIS
jgi:ComEC/Rec2-related protein